MSDDKTRSYSSPLRDRQAQHTRAQILDAVTDLLSERRADEVTTKEIAARAGVSQATVYRHFADRAALLSGLGERVADAMGGGFVPSPATLDGFGELIETMFAASDAHPVEVRAEVLLNSDPRSHSPDSRRRTAETVALVRDAFPELDDARHAQIAGLLRSLGSSQTWLKMREEFGVPGTESGPIVRWAIDSLVAAVRRGELPEVPRSKGTR